MTAPGARACLRCSICIATCGRPHELRACLDALARQIEPPDEIVVSDAGSRACFDAAIRGDARCSDAICPDAIIHCPTPRAALPWQRWWAFTHSTGDVVLFLDDDIRLMPGAVGLLREAYRQWPDLAGAGFTIAYDDNDSDNGDDSDDRYRNAGRSNSGHPRRAWRTHWLGIADARPGSITTGGITVDHPSSNGHTRAIEVDWLSGGAMSFRRTVLQAIGPLEGLFGLYDARIGKAEDAVLSHCARAHGPLRLIVGAHARHPELDRATRTATPQDGFRRGLVETWGRAHAVRWLACDPIASRRAWMRQASLEVARALYAALRQPVAASPWQRLAGDMVGIQRTVRGWHRIPAHAGAVTSAVRETAHAPIAHS